MSKGPSSKMLVQGNNLRLRDEGGSRGRSGTQSSKDQDIQHTLNQPRGSFPDYTPPDEVFGLMITQMSHARKGERGIQASSIFQWVDCYFYICVHSSQKILHTLILFF